MSFKEYLNEAKNPFDEKTIKKLSDMTDRNYHSEVVSKVADLLNNKKYIELVNAIELLEKFYGDMPTDLLKIRNYLFKVMLEEIKSKHGKETADKIYKSTK